MGFQKNGKQKWQCRSCSKYQQENYNYNAYSLGLNARIKELLNEGLSIRGIARILKIAIGTVINRIRQMSQQTSRKPVFEHGQIYEIDELKTYVGNKDNWVWVMICLNRYTKQVIDFVVGSRTKENLGRLVNSALLLNPKAICTDGLLTYRGLVPKHLHKVGLPHTRHIERKNLSIRTHQKRLNRKTICYSKSKEMLEHSLRLYLWSNN